MKFRFRNAPDSTAERRRVAWAAAAPWIASGVGALASSRGAKKAAKNTPEPDIPRIFKPAVSQGLRLLQGRLMRGFPAYTGQLTAPTNALEGNAYDLASSLLNSPQAKGGLQSAFDTTRMISETGLDPGTIEQIRKQLDPYFSYQKDLGLAGVREAEAQGGRFFSSGGVRAESDFLNQFLANQSAQLVPLALQDRQLRLEAAQQVPQQLLGALGVAGAGQGIGETQRSVEQAQLSALYQEWLRQQPENAIGLLAALMGGTPLSQAPIAPNFGQIAGANITGIAPYLVNSGKKGSKGGVPDNRPILQ